MYILVSPYVTYVTWGSQEQMLSIHNASIGSFLCHRELFYECKINGIIQKVVSLLKIKHNRHIDLIIHEASE